MSNHHGETHAMFLRLTDVLKSTGLSRSTVYNRIAKKEFPHQVSLGGRAVGWLKREVEDWINERVHLRPESAARIPRRGLDEQSARIRAGGLENRQSEKQITSPTSVIAGKLDPAKLHLVGTTLYFDSISGSFWLKLVVENSNAQGS